MVHRYFHHMETFPMGALNSGLAKMEQRGWEVCGLTFKPGYETYDVVFRMPAELYEKQHPELSLAVWFFWHDGDQKPTTEKGKAVYVIFITPDGKFANGYFYKADWCGEQWVAKNLTSIDDINDEEFFKTFPTCRKWAYVEDLRPENFDDGVFIQKD